MHQAVDMLSHELPQLGSAGHRATSEPTTFSTMEGDSFLAPAAYAINRKGWVHVFPEACVYQDPKRSMRYFKWGVSRLILEADPAPELVPMFIDGTQNIFPESRGWPRWAPRVGADIRISFGDSVDVEETFGAARAEWKALAAKHQAWSSVGVPGAAWADELKLGAEATALRITVAKIVRDQVQKLRLKHGFAVDDHSLALAETWERKPGQLTSGSHAPGGPVEKD